MGRGAGRSGRRERLRILWKESRVAAHTHLISLFRLFNGADFFSKLK